MIPLSITSLIFLNTLYNLGYIYAVRLKEYHPGGGIWYHISNVDPALVYHLLTFTCHLQVFSACSPKLSQQYYIWEGNVLYAKSKIIAFSIPYKPSFIL